jgi:phage-related protein
MMPIKPLHWMGNSLAYVRDFTDNAKREIGYQLDKVQRGGDPSDWKPLSIVGAGVRELRIHSLDEYRVVYLANLPEAVYVLHVFIEKSQRTNHRDLALAKARLRLLFRGRNS